MAGSLILTVNGFVGRDPETFDTKNGQGIKFSMGVSAGKDAPTEWVEIVAYDSDPNFNFISQYIKKGSSLTVVGSEKVRAYVNKQGEPVAAREVRASIINFAAGAAQRESNGDAEAETTTAAPRQQARATQPPQRAQQARAAQGTRQPAPPARRPVTTAAAVADADESSPFD